jgi:hypothetical protein
MLKKLTLQLAFFMTFSLSSSNQECRIILWSNSAMPQQPTTLTDQLANVIQVIQLGRKSGTLTVERSSGISLERGTVYFVNGLMTKASAHGLSGLAAFQWLNTWSSCRFTFTPSDSEITTRKLPSLRPAQLPEQEHESFHDTDPTQQFQAQAKAFPDAGIENNQNRHKDLSVQNESARIPKQLRSLEDTVQRIERMKLSRAHRRLFLLIDGHRNTADLARLMGRRQVEVVALLQDLERADVVKH